VLTGDGEGYGAVQKGGLSPLHRGRAAGGEGVKMAFHAKSLRFSALLALVSGCTGLFDAPAPGSATLPSCLEHGTEVLGGAPLRRITRFEYNNTVRDLLGDETQPANALPGEERGNGFGNAAEAQSVSTLLAEQYGAVGEGVARRATESSERLAQLAPCAAEVDASTSREAEVACVRSFVESFAPRAYRRPLDADEIAELMELQQAIRAGSDFRTSIASVIEAVLQSPDFLYRIETGVPDGHRPDVRRPTGYEMATRLSYFLWGTMPDETLMAAAEAGELDSPPGVHRHASRMVEDPRARATVRFFFDNLLPISSLADLARDPAQFPMFSSQMGAAMREETQQLLEHELFEGSGSWEAAITAPYTFVNEALANFYGMDGVTGDEFRRVPVDTSQRLGILTHASVLTGTTHSNVTSPVVRGAYFAKTLLCIYIPLPTAETVGEELLDQITPPDPDSGATARERYSAHSENPVCASCHVKMDPLGLALENYDPVGAWRSHENDVLIDASGAVPGVPGEVAGPVELVRRIAGTRQTHACFTQHWMTFALGRLLGELDACAQRHLEHAFVSSGYDVRQLLVSLTQTDAFLYLPADRGWP
jgi:hypothetical protein